MLMTILLVANTACYGPDFVCGYIQTAPYSRRGAPSYDSNYNAKLAKALGQILKGKKNGNR